jgi:hypothetical protein
VSYFTLRIIISLMDTIKDLCYQPACAFLIARLNRDLQSTTVEAGFRQPLRHFSRASDFAIRLAGAHSERFRVNPRTGRSLRARLIMRRPAARAEKIMSTTQRRGVITLAGAPAIAYLVTSALLSVVLALSWPAAISAHDIYTGLKTSSGRSCCAGHDCRPAHYRLTPAGVQMLISGRWIVVPNDTIQYRALDGDTGETAGGHWCGLPGGHVTVTYCAILPPSSAIRLNLKAARAKTALFSTRPPTR